MTKLKAAMSVKNIQLVGGPLDGELRAVQENIKGVEFVARDEAKMTLAEHYPYKIGTYEEAYAGASLFIFVGYAD